MGSFKFDWLSMRKKWVSLKENLPRNRLKKAPSIKQKEQETQTELKHTQVTLWIEPEFMENVEEYLDAITPEKIHHFKF